MILFNLGCFVLVFLNFIVSILPDTHAVKENNDPKLTKKFRFLLMFIQVLSIIASILGILGGYIHLLPFLLSTNDDLYMLISPTIFTVLFLISLIRINAILKPILKRGEE